MTPVCNLPASAEHEHGDVGFARDPQRDVAEEASPPAFARQAEDDQIALARVRRDGRDDIIVPLDTDLKLAAHFIARKPAEGALRHRDALIACIGRNDTHEHDLSVTSTL